MIYVQLRARVKLAQGETLHVADAANVLGSEKAGHCSLFCPTAPGVYTLDAIAVAKALKKVFPQEDISLIGADVCYVHRIKARGKDFLRPVRTAAALLILGGGVGNIIDRIANGYVVDMFDLLLFDYPVFNLADCFVVVGVILGAVYYLWFYEKYDARKKDDATDADGDK